MTNNELVGPDGKPVDRVPCVEVDGRLFPLRIVDRDKLAGADPRVAIMHVCVQIGDQANLSWMAMMQLARDIYARDTGIQKEAGVPRHFQKFAQDIGLTITDGKRQKIDVAQELDCP